MSVDDGLSSQVPALLKRRTTEEVREIFSQIVARLLKQRGSLLEVPPPGCVWVLIVVADPDTREFHARLGTPQLTELARFARAPAAVLARALDEAHGQALYAALIEGGMYYSDVVSITAHSLGVATNPGEKGGRSTVRAPS